MKLCELFENTNNENSLGKIIHHTPDGVTNFWRWFGNSKVVDSQHRPLVIYHGTGNDIMSFQPKNLNIEKTGHYLDFGIHFSGSNKIANTYALSTDRSTNKSLSSLGSEIKHGNPTIYPAYLKIEKLFDFSRDYNKIMYSVSQLGISVGMHKNPEYDKLLKNKPLEYLSILQNRIGRKQIRDIFLKKQYDGIVYTLHGIQCYIVFNPSQIKSAIGNNGNYSNSDNIHESRFKWSW